LKRRAEERRIPMRNRKRVLALFVVAAVVVAFTSVLWAAGVEKVNINKASVEEISKLEKIGPSYAERIVQYRKEHGPFEKPEDLMKVKGIGPKTFELNKNRISVD
jgi:competence protein ComEA